MNTKRYFGLHFDFHAKEDAKIGERTEKKDILEYINAAKPDYIQCDCKGHPGYTCYPSKFGNTPKGLVKDNLKIWCEAAHESNIPIFMHYSGVIDINYVEKHPEEAAVQNQEDSWRVGRTSVFGKYVDKLMIPQIKELIDNYGIDGIWVDGDCWAVNKDYSDYAKPYLKEDITTDEHNAIMREGYFKYFKHYVDELHKYKSDFSVISNWAYSSYIPEKPTVDVDSLSGDLPSVDSVYAARYEGRCLAAQNMPWDLMAWGFDNRNGYTEKSAPQLCQEAAMVVSLGGGFQVYHLQNCDGSISKNGTKRFETIGNFMHLRKAINFEKQSIAQVAVFYSATARYLKSNVFNAAGSTNMLIGTLNCVLDAQYTSNVLLEYQLDTVSDYNIIVVPEWENMGTNAENALLNYAKNGGNLVLSGAENCVRFAELADMKIGTLQKNDLYIYSDDECFSKVASEKYVSLDSGNGDAYFNRDLRDRAGASYKTAKIGKGTITYIPFDFGTSYFNESNYVLREYMKKLLEKIEKPVVKINHQKIDITMQKDGNDLIVNLINMREGRHSLTENTYNEILTAEDTEVVVYGKYKDVSMPLGEKFEYVILGDCVKIKLPKLDIHSVIKLTKQ